MTEWALTIYILMWPAIGLVALTTIWVVAWCEFRAARRRSEYLV